MNKMLYLNVSNCIMEDIFGLLPGQQAEKGFHDSKLKRAEPVLIRPDLNILI